MSGIFFVLINIAILLGLLGVLYKLQKRYVGFTKRVFIGLLLGAGFGIALKLVYGDGEVLNGTTRWLKVVGVGYIKLLKMLIIPLIMVSIISALTNLKNSKNLGKKFITIISTLLILTGISAGVGIFVSNSLNLSAENFKMGEKEEKRAIDLENRLTKVNNRGIDETILELIPENPFYDMAGLRKTSTISVVIISVFIGVGILGLKKKKNESADLATKFVKTINDLVMRIVTLVLRLTPYGIMALIARVVIITDYSSIKELGIFITASYLAIGLMFIIQIIALYIFGFNPLIYIKKVMPVLSFAFTSRSSAATIPYNIETQVESLGVSEELGSLSASLGATIGQNGCAGIYPAMLAVMIAPVVGVNPLDPTFIFNLIIVIIISSFGVAGVGGGATFAALIVLSSLNLPVGLAAILISIEPVIDMARTALNVNGSITTGLISAKIFSEVDLDRYNDKEYLSIIK